MVNRIIFFTLERYAGKDEYIVNINTNKMIEKLYDAYNYCLEKKDCQDLADDIIKIVNESGFFAKPLQEWINGKKEFTDMIVNGFSLVELASRLDKNCPNIPVSILILWLESQENMIYHGLAAIADYLCVANPKIVIGFKCEYALYKDELWYFMLSNQNDIELKEYQVWQILLLNPSLILQVAYEHPNNTALILQDDGSYLIVRDGED